MVTFAGVMMIILLFVFIGSIPITYFYIRRLEIPFLTKTLVIIRDSSTASGCAVGTLIGKKYIDGRVVLKILPKGEMNPVEFVTETNKVIVYPQGVWDKKIDIIEILPDDAQTFLANMFQSVENKNAENHIIQAQQEGMKLQQSHLIDMGQGEISRLNTAILKSAYEDALKKSARDDKTGKPGGYVSTAGPRDTFS